MPTAPHRHRDRRGAALVLALLMAFAVAGMAIGAIVLTSGARLSTNYNAREAALQSAANGGLEIIRDSVNHGNFDTLLPLNGYTTLLTNAPIVDAYGATMPRTTMSLYVGRTGGRTGGAATAGQYGSNFASGLAVIRDQRGAVAARRLLMSQESWSKFAVAINDWPGSAVYGCTESINGPFHSNDVLRLQSGCNPKILFAGPATVVGGVSNQSSGNFTAGLKTGVPPIDWPTPARISLMRQYAQDGDATNGDYDLTGSTLGSNTPGLRIEFLTIDANGDGVIEWDEGYMRVWHAKNTSDSALAYATAQRWPNQPSGTSGTSDPNMVTRNCGARVAMTVDTAWFTAREIYDSVYAATGSASYARDGVRWALSRGVTGTRRSPLANLAPTEQRCYQGGDPQLYHATAYTSLTPDSTRTDSAGHRMGFWQKRRLGAHSSVSGVRSDAEYLIPLGKNPNFKGVIFVQGDVAISGRLRGRASVFATGNIVMTDDLLYYTPPGTQCDAEGDIFGAIATNNVVISDNNIQTPFRINSILFGGYDDTPADEQYNMFFLAAGDGTSGKGNWYTAGLPTLVPGGPSNNWLNTGTIDASATAERCGEGPAGCARVTGGLAMGKVEYYTYYPGFKYGYAEAHAYDKCGAVNPPPYFPTTGRFIANRYYEIDPVWLNDKGIANYFADLRAQ